jgi:2-phospho-L-lactate guanylyltransferase (CobY/MobA/RfbA family)
VPRRAVLIFAEKTHVDLARRSFPMAARPLLNLPALGPAFSPAIDVHLFTSAGDANLDGPNIHRQSGRGFAARFENAIEMIVQLGYDEVVVIGRDCPTLRALDIERAFAELKSSKLVLGPDHRGGCYLIAFRSADRALLRDVRWKRNTDCAELRRRGGAAQVFLLTVKHDLDSWSDLRLFAGRDDVLAGLAAFLLASVRSAAQRTRQFVSFASRHIRISQQMPPPAVVA